MKVKKLLSKMILIFHLSLIVTLLVGELLMRELKPNLKDDDNNIFPIGLFFILVKN